MGILDDIYREHREQIEGSYRQELLVRLAEEAKAAEPYAKAMQFVSAAQAVDIARAEPWLREYIWGYTPQIYKCARCGEHPNYENLRHLCTPERFIGWVCPCGHISIRNFKQRADR